MKGLHHQVEKTGIRKFKFAAELSSLMLSNKSSNSRFLYILKLFFDIVWVKFIISKGIECFKYFLYDLKVSFLDN